MNVLDILSQVNSLIIIRPMAYIKGLLGLSRRSTPIVFDVDRYRLLHSVHDSRKPTPTIEVKD